MFEAAVQSDVIDGVVVALCQHKLILRVWYGRLSAPPVQNKKEGKTLTRRM